MKIFSFDSDTSNNKIKRDPKQGNLFNLFQKNLTNVQNLPLKIYIVPREYEMRLDRISEHIYGTSDYVEELMSINDIISPYSVKEGQYIYFCEINVLQNLYTTDNLTDTTEINRQDLMSSSQPNRDKTSVNSNENLPTTIKPSNLEQIKVGVDNSVQIINSFE